MQIMTSRIDFMVLMMNVIFNCRFLIEIDDNYIMRNEEMI